MSGNLNAYTPHKPKAAEESKQDSSEDMAQIHEEITVCKTEVIEEMYDFEMPVEDMESMNVEEEVCEFETSAEDINLMKVKKEDIYLPENNYVGENLELTNSKKHLLSENLVFGNCKFKEEDLRKHNYTCKLCYSDFDEEAHLEKHICIHTKEKPFKCTHKNCKYSTKLKGQLDLHISAKHVVKSKKYKCKNCKFTTPTKATLERHSRTHTNDRPFKCTYKNCNCIPGKVGSCECDTCEYAFAQEQNLKNHILAKHSEEPKKYECSDCKYATHRKRDLERHTRTHTNEKRFKCTYKNCKCKPGQEAPCQCDMCKYETIQGNNLKRHILIMHSAEPKKYTCSDCKYATHLKAHLKVHIRTHINGGAFEYT